MAVSVRRSIWVTGFALATTAGFFAMSPWTRASAPRLSREALASAFYADMRHVVYEWDPGDPRPQSERRQALFDFMYETYNASA